MPHMMLGTPPAGGATEWHALRSLSGRSPKLLGCCLESYGLLEQLWRLCFAAPMLAQHSQRVLNAAITHIKRGEAVLAMHTVQPHHPYAPMQPVCGL